MIDSAALGEIIATYQKHGWVLRRVLLSDIDTPPDGLSEVMPAGVPVLGSDIDAAWFSRPFKAGGVVWEIRYLGDNPYALLETFDNESPDFEAELRFVETRLRDTVTARTSA